MSRRVERRFVSSDDISRYLFCSICTDVFLDPTRLFCSHTFCRKCITHWIKDHSNCPICREEVQLEIMGKDLIADKMIQDLQVLCPNTPCEWQDTLENLEKHSKTCTFSKTPEWLEKDQNYIKIDDELTGKDGYWPNIKSTQQLPTISFGPFDENSRSRLAPEIYCMALFQSVCARNPAVKDFFENFMSRSTIGTRRNSLSENFSFEIQNNFVFPIVTREEETKQDPRGGQGEVIVGKKPAQRGRKTAEYKKTTKKKKNSIDLDKRNYRNNNKGSKRLKTPTDLIEDENGENYEAKIAEMAKIKRNPRRGVNELISLVDESSDGKVIKNAKAGLFKNK